MAIAEVNGQRLYHEVHGDGEPLLCVAGLTCDTLVWIPQVQAFSAAHRTVIFDNRDAGQSSMATGDYEIADMARDALALADELELDTFHLLGVSMGGAIAQEIALQAPDRIRTLTLAVTFPAGGAYARRLAEVWSARVEAISAGAARRRADAAEPLRGLLRPSRDGRVHPHGDAEQPASAAARGVRASDRRVRPPRHPRPARLAHACRCT